MRKCASALNGSAQVRRCASALDEGAVAKLPLPTGEGRGEGPTQHSALSTQHFTQSPVRVLLKARPTEAQLADRLADPPPSGLELYLDAEDLSDHPRLVQLAHKLNELRPDPGFVYVVEGPIRSLDGSFFDLSRDSEPNRECLRRIAWLAEAIGAEAILVHAITPMGLEAPLGPDLHRATLERCLPLVEYFVQVARAGGLIPLLENIPPVARQREAAYLCTPVGMSAEDLAFFATTFPGLMVTLDVSHAQLFLNGLRLHPEEVDPKLAPLVRYLSTLDRNQSMGDYIEAIEPYLFEAHISNARGLLDEGLPYGDGDLDLDSLAARLARSVRYLVTETIEPDADRALHMGEARLRLEAVLENAPRRGALVCPPPPAGASNPWRQGIDPCATPGTTRPSNGAHDPGRQGMNSCPTSGTNRPPRRRRAGACPPPPGACSADSRGQECGR